LLLALGVAGSPALAQAEGETSSLSLTELSGLVKKGLPEAALIRARVLDAEAEVEGARTLPELGLSLQREEVFVDGEGVGLENSLSLEWSLDVSGRRGLRINAADAGLRAARLRGERAHSLIAIDATAIYLQAARARLRLESLSASREPLAKLTGALTRRAKEGDVSGADLARFELALSEHDDRVAKAEAEVEVAEKRLASLLGRPGRVVASDELPLPQTPGQAQAAATRSDLRAASEELAGGRALIKAASRWWVPTLDLSLGYLSTDPGAGPDVAHGYTAGLSLSLPVFSRGQAERKRGEAQVARGEARRRVLERRVSAEIEAAQTLLSSRIERSRTHESKRLVLAAELVKKTESAYSGGEASALELRDGYEKSADARLRAIDLRFQARMAELELRRAQGIDPEAGSR
jgi:cobalt-zinc-cadmium efflux system outer membrane protein